MRVRQKLNWMFKKLLGIWIAIFMFSTISLEVRADINATNGPNYYYIYGVYGIVQYVLDGAITPNNACDWILIPVFNQGNLNEVEAEIFAAYFPETEKKLIDCGALTKIVSYEMYLDAQDCLRLIGYEEWCTPYAHEDLRKQNIPMTPQYTIEDCDMYKYATTDVNMRVEPSTNTNKVGNVPQNEKVHVTGKTSNGWYRLEYNGTTGFSVSKYFADKPIEKVENVTDVPEPTPEPTPVPTEVPTAEPTAEPTVEPTATPEPTEVPNDTKTEIVEPLETEKPVATPVPTVIPTEAPVEDEPTAETTAKPVTDVTEPTSAPVVDIPVVSEAVKETNNLIPWIALGGVVVALGVVVVIVLRRKK